MRFAPRSQGVQMDAGGVHQYRVITRSIAVRERKQMKSKKVGTLKENDIVDIKVFWKNMAMVTAPMAGWINFISAKGELLLKTTSVEGGRERKESTGRSASRNNSSTSDLSSMGSSSMSTSRSLSKTPEPHRNAKFSELEGSILLIPNASNTLVMVCGYYGTILGKAYNGDSEFFNVLLDGQTEPCFMIGDDITFLNEIPEEITWEEESSLKKRFIRRCTKHNRYSTRIPVTYRRKRLCRHNYRVRFDLEEEETLGIKRAESFTIERPIDQLDELTPVEIVSLLDQMMKRDLFEIPDHSKFTEAELHNLKTNQKFQEAYLTLHGVC